MEALVDVYANLPELVIELFEREAERHIERHMEVRRMDFSRM